MAPGAASRSTSWRVEETELVASDEIRRSDQVRRADRPRPEAQVRDRLRARFVRVVDEIALGIEPRVLGDDLDAVLVGADRAIGAQAVEHRAHHVVRLDREVRIDFEAGMGDIVARCRP